MAIKKVLCIGPVRTLRRAREKASLMRRKRLPFRMVRTRTLEAPFQKTTGENPWMRPRRQGADRAQGARGPGQGRPGAALRLYIWSVSALCVFCVCFQRKASRERLERELRELPEAGELQNQRGGGGEVSAGRENLERERVCKYVSMSKCVRREKWLFCRVQNVSGARSLSEPSPAWPLLALGCHGFGRRTSLALPACGTSAWNTRPRSLMPSWAQCGRTAAGYLEPRYTYKLCFFKDAKQSFTRLGSWSGCQPSHMTSHDMTRLTASSRLEASPGPWRRSSRMGTCAQSPEH